MPESWRNADFRDGSSVKRGVREEHASARYYGYNRTFCIFRGSDSQFNQPFLQIMKARGEAQTLQFLSPLAKLSVRQASQLLGFFRTRRSGKGF